MAAIINSIGVIGNYNNVMYFTLTYCTCTLLMYIMVKESVVQRVLFPR